MTSEPEHVLRALMTDLCASEDGPTFVARWGRPVPSRRRPGGIRVECDPDGPFTALEVRPWSEDVTGVVDVELADRPHLSWETVRERLGPFESMTSLDGFSGRYAAQWHPAGEGASAYLMVHVRDDAVGAITIRRDLT